MNNYQLPPKAEQRNVANIEGKTTTRRSNFTILSQEASVHPSGVNSELAGNIASSFGSKPDLTDIDSEAANTANKNYLKTEELTPID